MGCNGEFAPPNQNCYVLDIMEFLPPTLRKSYILGQNTKLHPPNLIYGYATAFLCLQKTFEMFVIQKLSRFYKCFDQTTNSISVYCDFLILSCWNLNHLFIQSIRHSAWGNH